MHPQQLRRWSEIKFNSDADASRMWDRSQSPRSGGGINQIFISARVTRRKFSMKDNQRGQIFYIGFVNLAVLHKNCSSWVWN